MSNPEEPKLIIDSDWKAQAQAEKERLAANAKPKAPESAAPGQSARAAPASDAIGFQDLVSLLVTQALTYMGAYPDPRTGKAVLAPEYAKLYIDLLGVVEEKTKGNLNEQEQALIIRALSELRMEFVEVVKAIDKAVAEGKIKPNTGGPGAGPGLVMPDMGGFGGSGVVGG
jgi:hypothetical protein